MPLVLQISDCSGREIARMKITVECEREEDGRWLAEVLELPGVFAYGASSEEAIARAETLAQHVLASL